MAGPRNSKKSSKDSKSAPATSTSQPHPPKTKQSISILLPIIFALAASAIWAYQHQLLPSQTNIEPAEEIEDISGPSWNITDVGGGKGRGVIALRNIAQGELIIRQTADEIRGKDGSHQGTYSAAINHGCGGTVNVAWHWTMSQQVSQESEDQASSATNEGSEETETDEPSEKPRTAPPTPQPELRIYALKDITKGEELLGGYIDTRLPRAARLDQLWEEYWFNCTCSICSLPEDSEESHLHEERLTRMGEIYPQLTSWAEGKITGLEAMDFARELWKLSEDEGYFHGRAQLAEEASYIAAAHSDASALEEWNNLAYHWSKIEFGEDNERTLRTEQLRLMGPAAHMVWGVAEPLIVGGPSTSEDIVA